MPHSAMSALHTPHSITKLIHPYPPSPVSHSRQPSVVCLQNVRSNLRGIRGWFSGKIVMYSFDMRSANPYYMASIPVVMSGRWACTCTYKVLSEGGGEGGRKERGRSNPFRKEGGEGE